MRTCLWIGCALVVATAAGAASAAEVYRWVDQDGKTHVSDHPPPPGVSGPVDRGTYEDPVMPDDRRAAERRAAADRARVRALDDQYRIDAQRANARASAPAGAPARTGTPDCAQRLQDYRNSQACYAGYRTRYGMRGGAAGICGPAMADPSVDCGIPRNP